MNIKTTTEAMKQNGYTTSRSRYGVDGKKEGVFLTARFDQPSGRNGRKLIRIDCHCGQFLTRDGRVAAGAKKRGFDTAKAVSVEFPGVEVRECGITNAVFVDGKMVRRDR